MNHKEGRRKSSRRTPRSKKLHEKEADEAHSGSIGRAFGDDGHSSTESFPVEDGIVLKDTLQFTKDEERVIIKSGKLQDIIDHYTSNATEKLAILHLVLAHPHFFPTAMLLQELREAFNRAKAKEKADMASTQFRYCLAIDSF
eukprot:TRINITY_DN4941_c0_g1_i1.p1 TRINITY_DN4941_c0_g1~~TRINITY_DN4941_c0_g1_i1.p1  ORF type:complete len:143 (-),score=28.19 TRINITY_DN4941_c0_g1_i1:30-458(-)